MVGIIVFCMMGIGARCTKSAIENDYRKSNSLNITTEQKLLDNN
jgi:hypothetical protein